MYALVEDLSLGSHTGSLTDEPATIPAQFSTKFHGMHHVELFHPASRNADTSGSIASSSRTAFVDRRSASYSVPFHVGNVVFSDPYWLIPARDRIGDRGSFRIGIAFESRREASIRTRLQYHIRIDLDTYQHELGAAQSQIGSNSGSGDATTSPAELVPYPRLRGRISSYREAPESIPAKLWVGFGKHAIVSLWNSPDGIHAHTR